MFMNLSMYFVGFSLKGSELQKMLFFDNMVEYKLFKVKPRGRMILCWSQGQQMLLGIPKRLPQAVSLLTCRLLILRAPCIYRVTSHFNTGPPHRGIFVSGEENNFCHFIVDEMTPSHLFPGEN